MTTDKVMWARMEFVSCHERPQFVALLLVACLVTPSGGAAPGGLEDASACAVPVQFEKQALAPVSAWVRPPRGAAQLRQAIGAWFARQKPWFWAMGLSKGSHEIKLLLAAYVYSRSKDSPLHWMIMRARGPITARSNKFLRNQLLADLGEFSIRALHLRVTLKAQTLAKPDIFQVLVDQSPASEILDSYVAANLILSMFERPPLPVRLIGWAEHRRVVVETILAYYTGVPVAEQEYRVVRDVPGLRDLLDKAGYGRLKDDMLLDDIGRLVSSYLSGPFAWAFGKQRLGIQCSVLMDGLAWLEKLSPLASFDNERERILNEGVAQDLLTELDRRLLSVILYDHDQVGPFLAYLWNADFKRRHSDGTHRSA